MIIIIIIITLGVDRRRSVSRSVTYSKSCKNSCSDRDDVCIDDSGGPRETPVAYNGPLWANTVLCSFNTIQPSSS